MAEVSGAPAHVTGGSGVRVGPHRRAPPCPKMALFSFLSNLPASGCDPVVSHLCQQRESCLSPVLRIDKSSQPRYWPAQRSTMAILTGQCERRGDPLWSGISTVEWNTTSGETGAEANQCQVLTLGTGRQYMPRDRKIGYLNGR